MMMRRQLRHGAILVESAVIYSAVFLIVLGIILMSIAVFRYQQVAQAAREGARWASVHGGQYSKELSMPATTPDAIYTNAIRPHTAGMNPASVTYSVTWNKNQQQASPYIGTDPVTKKPITLSQSNTVSVTVTYSWDTGLFGVIPVSSTAVAIMSY
jgi:Flp pilus assembly protein TadG